MTGATSSRQAWSHVLHGDPVGDVPDTADLNGTDAAEYELFFRTHHRELARVAYLMTGNHAEADDVVAEALLSAWRRWHVVRAADSTIAYVRRAVVNISITRVKRSQRERTGTSLMGPLTRWVDDTDVAARHDLRAAVLALPAGRRACVVLRHVAEMSTTEVARTLGISEGTVKSQTAKGLAQLRRALGGEGFDGYRRAADASDEGMSA